MDRQVPENQQGDILLVDDAVDSMRFLTSILTDHGYSVRCASSGPLALAAVQEKTPDLILLDVRMPGMDGYAVCERLKADERTRSVPVLFISALDNIADKVRGFQAGAVDYIAKPYQFEEVLARIATHLTLRNLQADLRKQIDERDLLIAELDAYAHTVAHDLRNPAHLVLAWSEVMTNAAQNDAALDEVRELAGYISAGANRIVNIIDSLLLLATVRSAEVRITDLNMAAIVAQAMERLGPELEAYRAEIVLPDNWPVARGYEPWVEEVWVNYLSNAIKYGGRPDADPPEPSIVRVGATREGDVVCYWVQDNGPGIAPEDQDTLFLPFSRLGQSSHSGYGLGLSIVRRIVARLGGRVALNSASGRGSTFIFTLPASLMD